MAVLRILVVEPEAATRAIVREAASCGGHEVVEVSTAEEAIAAHAAHPTDVAVVASPLQGLDAPELVTILKGRSRHTFPVLVVGRSHEAARRFASFDSGADEWLPKPLVVSEIEARIGCFARVVQLSREVERLQDEIEALTSRDPETGTYARRFIHTQARLEQTRAERYGEALSVVLLEVDGIARLEDRGAADVVVREVAARASASTRRCDLIARTGYNRFMMLMPNTSTVGAYFAAEKVRDSVSERPVVREGSEIPVAVAIGVSTYQERNFPDTSAFLDSAEEALIQARRQGPGSVVLFHPVARA